MATLPPQFKIAYAELSAMSGYLSSRSRSLRYIQRKNTGQAWDFIIRSIKIEDIYIKGVIAGISAINRDNSDVLTSLPIYSDSDATSTTTLQSRPRGQFDITMNDINNVAVGDFFTFSGHLKAYQVTEVIGSQVVFAPNLVVNVGSNEVVTFDGMMFNFKLAGRPQVYPLSSNDQSIEVELELIEKW